jgi:DNA-binding NarL/FixJ family response regulator
VISVVIVDDHGLVRAGLAALLDTAPDIVVIGEAADGEQALHVIRTLCPDVVLMDISMPGIDGIVATRDIRQELPATRVIGLTSFSDHERVSQMLSAGAIGYLLKDCEPTALLAAVRAAARGEVPIDPRVAAAVLPGATGARVAPGAPVLTVREFQVLRLCARGLANKQIGRQLGITERTVKVHLGNVFRRIGVSDRTSAALWARDNAALIGD